MTNEEIEKAAAMHANNCSDEPIDVHDAYTSFLAGAKYVTEQDDGKEKIINDLKAHVLRLHETVEFLQQELSRYSEFITKQNGINQK